MTVKELLKVFDLTPVSEFKVNGISVPLYVIHSEYYEHQIKQVSIQAQPKEFIKEDVNIVLYNDDTVLDEVEIVLPPLTNYIHIILSINV